MKRVHAFLQLGLEVFVIRLFLQKLQVSYKASIYVHIIDNQ